MATAEIVRDASTSVTQNATPLVANTVQGSTQMYGVAPNSRQSPTPTFFAPRGNHGELIGYWGSLLRGTIRNFYTFIFVCTPPSSVFGSALCESPLAWDRLNVELMRIASLGSNWDGEGAEAVHPRAAANMAVLLNLARIATEQSRVLQPSVPALIPDVEGGIILKWVLGIKELNCTVLDDIVEVIRWKSPDRYESDGFWDIPVHRVAEHFEWLLQQ